MNQEQKILSPDELRESLWRMYNEQTNKLIERKVPIDVIRSAMQRVLDVLDVMGARPVDLLEDFDQRLMQDLKGRAQAYRDLGADEQKIFDVFNSVVINSFINGLGSKRAAAEAYEKIAATLREEADEEE